MMVFLLCLVWGLRTAMLPLSGFCCRILTVQGLANLVLLPKDAPQVVVKGGKGADAVGA